MTPLTAIILEAGELYHDRRVYRLSRVPNTHLGVKCQACEFVVHVPQHHGRDRAEQIRRDHLKYAHCSALISGQVVFSLPDSEVASPADVLGTQAGASTSAARGTAGRSSGLRRTPARPSQSRQSGRRSTRAG